MHLDLTVREIVNLLNGTTSIDPDLQLRAITSLEKANQTDLAIVLENQEGSVFNDLSSEVIEKTNAGAIIARHAIVPGKPYILVDDPLLAFEKLISKIQQIPSIDENEYLAHSTAVIGQRVLIGEKTFIGSHAVIEDGAHIGKECQIGAGVYIGKKCRLGNNVFIHPHVTLLERTEIGDNTIIHSGAVIGSDGFGYHISKRGMRKIPHIGTVRIGNNVEIGANTCIDRAVFNETIISDHVKLDNQIHIAHNVYIGPHTAIIAQSGIAGSSHIGAGCQIGGQVGIKDHIHVGDGAKIVSQSGVMRNVEKGEIVAGAPAMPFGEWKRVTVALMKLPSLLQRFKQNDNKKYSFFPKWLRSFFSP